VPLLLDSCKGVALRGAVRADVQRQVNRIVLAGAVTHRRDVGQLLVVELPSGAKAVIVLAQGVQAAAVRQSMPLEDARGSGSGRPGASGGGGGRPVKKGGGGAALMADWLSAPVRAEWQAAGQKPKWALSSSEAGTEFIGSGH